MYGLVSIIMPAYNCAEYIGESIRSVIDQTYENWELIIVDDCSTDNTIEIMKGFSDNDSRIKIFYNEKNSGAAYTRNYALRKAKGRWIAFLDSDDLWLPEKLEKQLSFMEANKYNFSYTFYQIINEDSSLTNQIILGPKVINRRKMLHYCYLGCLTAMYNAESLGLIQIDVRIGNGRNDYAMWLQLSKKTKCYLLKEVLAKYRIRNVSLSHTSYKRLIRYHYEMFKYGEGFGAVHAWLATIRNLLFGILKKLFYKRKIDVTKEK